MATASRYWDPVGSRDTAWCFSNKLPYGWGAGRRSSEGTGPGATDSPTRATGSSRTSLQRGDSRAISAIAIHATITNAIMLLRLGGAVSPGSWAMLHSGGCGAVRRGRGLVVGEGGRVAMLNPAGVQIQASS